MNDARLYPTGTRILAAYDESMDELREELQDGQSTLQVTESAGDDLAEVANAVIERWYDKQAVSASEMLKLSKAVDLWREWRMYGG